MVRERRSRNIQFFLNFARDQSAGMSREQQPENCQAGFRAQGRKTVRRPRNQQRVGLLHISIIAEIQKQCQAVFATPPAKLFCQRSLLRPHPTQVGPSNWLWKCLAIGFDRPLHAWDPLFSAQMMSYLMIHSFLITSNLSATSPLPHTTT